MEHDFEKDESQPQFWLTPLVVREVKWPSNASPVKAKGNLKYAMQLAYAISLPMMPVCKDPCNHE